MPISRSRKRGTVRRARKRTRKSGRKYYRKRNYAKTTRMVASSKPVAERFLTKLRYSETLVFTFTGTAVGTFTIQSSLFDPNAGVGGHQPYGFDQLSTLYNRYRVYGFKYKLHMANLTNYTAQMWLRNTDESTVVTDSELLSERPDTQMTMIGPVVGYPIRMFKGYHDCAKMHGITKKQFNMRPEFEALTTTNPANVSYLALAARALDGSATGTMSVTIVIDFYCMFFDPFELNKS